MDDRLIIETSTVERLVAAQFPAWSGLPVTPVENGGWCNRTFRLGPSMSVRLPSAARYVAQVEKEYRRLPKLAAGLPLPIPKPLALGAPGEDYPWPWAVYRWIEGKRSGLRTISDLTTFAGDLADVLKALWAIDTTDGPPAGPHSFHRGGDLEVYDEETRRAIETLGDRVDASLMTGIWERARGWGLWKSLIVVAGLPGTNPLAIPEHHRWMERIVADHLSGE